MLFSRIRNIIGCIINKERRRESIYNRRRHLLISIVNNTVRKQKKDTSIIPIIIINYNRLADLKTLITFLQDRKHKNIIIVDNKSTYPPLLEYYKTIEHKVVIEKMDKNYGHMVFWENRYLYEKYSKGYYIITDADIIPNKNLPQNYIEQLINILDKHKSVTKVGFALRIDNIPESYIHKQKVIDWEKKYWDNPIAEDLYLNELDTTFAVYPPRYNYNLLNFYFAIRVAGNFTAQHNGWYIDDKNLTEEEVFYFKTANESNSWKINTNNN